MVVQWEWKLAVPMVVLKARSMAVQWAEKRVFQRVVQLEMKMVARMVALKVLNSAEQMVVSMAAS
jgi:hypothetical protein